MYKIYDFKIMRVTGLRRNASRMENAIQNVYGLNVIACSNIRVYIYVYIVHYTI